MPDLDEALFKFGQLTLSGLEFGLFIGPHIKQHPRLRYIRRNLFKLMLELLALFVDLGVFEKLLLIGGGSLT